MIKLLPYILKTLWRHRSRTILTVSGSAVALFVFLLRRQRAGRDERSSADGKRKIWHWSPFKPTNSARQPVTCRRTTSRKFSKIARRSRSRADSGLHQQLPSQLGRRRVLRRSAEKTPRRSARFQLARRFLGGIRIQSGLCGHGPRRRQSPRGQRG